MIVGSDSHRMSLIHGHEMVGKLLVEQPKDCPPDDPDAKYVCFQLACGVTNCTGLPKCTVTIEHNKYRLAQF